MESFDLDFDYCDAFLESLESTSEKGLSPNSMITTASSSGRSPIQYNLSPQDVLSGAPVDDVNPQLLSSSANSWDANSKDALINEPNGLNTLFAKEQMGFPAAETQPLTQDSINSFTEAFPSLTVSSDGQINQYPVERASSLSTQSSPHNSGQYSSYTSESESWSAKGFAGSQNDQGSQVQFNTSDVSPDEADWNVKKEDEEEALWNYNPRTMAKSGADYKDIGKPDTRTSKVTKVKKEKTSHNMIEKKYRTNINDKILALRDCVPALRCIVPGNNDEDLEGLEPASKLNKATILTKATEYIIHLQQRNDELLQELQNSKRRFAGSAGSAMDAQHSNLRHRAQMSNGARNGDRNDHGNHATSGGHRQSRGSNALSKGMMCSMAAMLGTSMLGDNNDSNIHGLAAIPWLSPYSHIGGTDLAISSIKFAKLALILGTIGYVLLPLFAFSGSKDSKGAIRSSVLSNSLRSSELYQHTWLTSTQLLTVPSKDALFTGVLSMITAVVQLVCKALFGLDGFMSICQLFGRTYASLALSQNSIIQAVDAQLCGGDVECSRPRLFYMLLKAYLTPADAERYVFQSLQVQVIFYKSRNPLQAVANYVSRRLWKDAREYLNANQAVDDSTEDETKSQLALALEQTDGPSPQFVRRISRLAYGIDSTPDSESTASTLDLLCCSYSEAALNKALQTVLCDDVALDSSLLHKSADMAPSASAARRRAVVTQALLLGSENPSYIKNAIDELQSVTGPVAQQDEAALDTDFDSESDDTISTSPVKTSRLSNELTSLPGTRSFGSQPTVAIDCKIAMYCSLVLYYMGNGQEVHASEVAKRCKMHLKEDDQIGLLGFVALWKALSKISASKGLAADSDMESLASNARIWIGSESADSYKLSLARRRELVAECVKMSMHFGGIQLDEGYSSV